MTGMIPQIQERLPPLGRQVVELVRERQVSFLAASLAFYAALAIFPAAAAAIAMFGLLVEADQVEQIVTTSFGAAPDDVTALLTSQLQSLADAPSGGLGIGVALSIALLLWSASSGMRALIRAINLVHGAENERGFLELRTVSFVATLISIVTAALVFGLLTFFPTVAPEPLRQMVELARWPVLALLGLAALTALYEFGPLETPSSGLAVSSVGALVALVSWLAASFLLTAYLSWAGGINEAYGAFGAGVVLLLWLYVSAYAILGGAILDHAIAQTRSDP